jgi:hypothetical protein
MLFNYHDSVHGTRLQICSKWQVSARTPPARLMNTKSHTNNDSEAHQYLPYLIFCIEGAISLFYLGGCIALAVFLAHQKLCAGSTCMASQADAVFAALTYVLWAASATFRGIEISEFGKSVELTDEMNEKIVEEV